MLSLARRLPSSPKVEVQSSEFLKDSEEATYTTIRFNSPRQVTITTYLYELLVSRHRTIAFGSAASSFIRVINFHPSSSVSLPPPIDSTIQGRNVPVYLQPRRKYIFNPFIMPQCGRGRGRTGLARASPPPRPRTFGVPYIYIYFLLVSYFTWILPTC